MVGAVLLIMEISALPRDLSSNNSPSTHDLRTRRYHGSTDLRNPSTSKHQGFRTRQYNGTARAHYQRNPPHSYLSDQMQGRAIFYADPDVEHTPNRQSNFVRKAGHSVQLTDRTVNDTIEQVEEIMKDNPHLPRLSRQEMINIIQNITKGSTEFNTGKNTDQTTENKSREDYIRSLMLVMPFNTNNLSDSMIQDLYTKPPITEIINTTPSTPVTAQQWRIVVGEVTKEHPIAHSKGTTIPTTEATTGTTTEKLQPSTFSYTIPRNTEKYKTKLTEFGVRQRPKINIVTTQKPSTVVEKFTVPRYRVRTTKTPVVSTEDPLSTIPKYRLKTTQKPTTVFQYPESTLARLRAKTTKAPFIVMATSVTAKPFKRIPEEVTIPTPLMTENNTPIRKDVKELLASLGLFPLDQENINDSESTTILYKDHLTTTTPNPFPVDVKKGADTLSPEMQTLLKSFGLIDNEIPLTKDSAPRPTISLQTSNYDPPPPEPTVDIESYATFKPLPNPGSSSSASTVKFKHKMGDDMKEFLVSFGLMDTGNETNTDQTSSTEEQKPRKYNSRSRGRKYEETNYNQRRRDKKKEGNSTSPIDLSIDTDMLPDDMKGVLKTLGLAAKMEGRMDTTRTTNDISVSTTLKPETTSTIKTTTNTNTTFEEITTEKILTTTIATHLTTIMDNDESNTNVSLTPSIRVNATTEVGNNTTTEGHIFSPKDAVPNTEDIEHLNELLKTVRLLANGTTPEELEYILRGDPKQLIQSSEENTRKEKMTTLEQAKNPPDPLSFEELVHILNEAKNEVKRQQDSKSSDSKNNTTTPPTIEASESGAGPSVEDLAASFGGSDDEEEESELPPPSSRPNGLYFLLDWNSFLEVGEDNSRVNLRFAPKLGDSRNFLPVTVP
ncbi:proteoglycan 4-like [Hetaerina americana]|uniref:proteoglycan 4-like n=1 Tax=Hetaerina americana TaxID=62018 RepID=UPI003A7F2B3A